MGSTGIIRVLMGQDALAAKGIDKGGTAYAIWSALLCDTR